MSKVRFRGMDVKMKLVGDIRRGKDAEKSARVVEGRAPERKPRVDIKTEVETYGSSYEGDKSGRARASQVSTGHGQPVAAGGGVLGFRMAELGGGAEVKTGGPEIPRFVEDPSQTTLEDLQRYQGMTLKVTVYDPDEYGSLQDANRKGDSIDRVGTLDEVKGAELVMTSDGRTAGLDTETWAVAKVEVSRGPWSSRANYEAIEDALLPGAPVQAKMIGNRVIDGTLLGTGKDERGNGYVDVLDQAGAQQRLPLADLYDLSTQGYSFTALTREQGRS